MISLGVWCEKLTLRVFMLPMKGVLIDHHGLELMTVEIFMTGLTTVIPLTQVTLPYWVGNVPAVSRM
jgi:hypothetical protein